MKKTKLLNIPFKLLLQRKIEKSIGHCRNIGNGWNLQYWYISFLFYKFLSEIYTNYNSEISGLSPTASFEDKMLYDKGFIFDKDDIYNNARSKIYAQEFSFAPEFIGDIFERFDHYLNTSQYDRFYLKNIFYHLKYENFSFPVNHDKIKRTFQALDIFNITLQDIRENKIDIFHFVYNYILNKYSSSGGKSMGEYLTPEHLANLMARIVVGDKKIVKNVYDFACGTGTLLMAVQNLIGREHITEGLYGQDINPDLCRLAKMHSFLNNEYLLNWNILTGDVLANPLFTGKAPFDIIIANPPYSIKFTEEHSKFFKNSHPNLSLTIPSRFADYAFILHALDCLDNNGTAVILVFLSMLDRKGNERAIREHLIKSNYVDCVISLPPKIFPGTKIATAILVLKKNKIDNKILFVNANDFYDEVNENKKSRYIFSEASINLLATTVKERKDISNFAKLVDLKELEEKEYTLIPSAYVKEKMPTWTFSSSYINEILEDILYQQHLLTTKFNIAMYNFEKLPQEIKRYSAGVCKLGDYCKIIRGVRLDKYKDFSNNLPDVEIALLRGSDLNTDDLFITKEPLLSIPKKILKINDEQYLQAEDITIVTRSRNFKQLERVAYIAHSVPNFAASEFLAILRPNKNFILPKYLAYVLLSFQWKNYLKNISSGLVFTLDDKIINDFTFKIYSLNIQHEIVHALDTFSMELQDKLQETTKELQLHYRHIFNMWPNHLLRS